MKKINLVICYLIIGSALMAQKPIDLKLTLKSVQARQSCYDISVKTGSSDPIKLAGQNYRIFYDADNLNFLKSATQSALDPRSYSAPMINDTDQNGIGLLSISIDGHKLTDETITLIDEDQWMKTMSICFGHESNLRLHPTWADNERTSHLATAEVAISEWLDKDHHNVLDVLIHEDFENNQVVSYEDQEGLVLKVYPNPFTEYINIDIQNEKQASILLIKDVMGREVIYENISGKQSLHYDLVNWPYGTYTIDVFDSNALIIYTSKVIKTGSLP